jgi:hypothetical protein
MDDAQRALLKRILQSRHFVNAESLKRTLQYICEHASGPDDTQPKELEIATEALGRPGSFDPRADPIVRVNVASIRERLEAFFQNEGRREPLRLEIPREDQRGRSRPAFATTAGASARSVAPPAGQGDNVLVFSPALSPRRGQLRPEHLRE